MKQKLFSLLTLLLVVCSSAWAVEESYVADARHAAEVTSESSYNGTAFNFSKSAAYSIEKDKSQASAEDASGLTFDYGFFPSGSTGESSCFTLTALKDISSIKIYYTMSDSKFTTSDQSKSGTLTWKIGSGSAQTSTNTSNKSNKTAYVQTLSDISKDDVIKIYSSANRLVIFGIYATYITAPAAISFDPAAGYIEEGVAVTLTSTGATEIKYQWGASAIDGDGDWTSATVYSNETKPVVPAVGSSNNVLSVWAHNNDGDTYGSATYTITAPKTVTTTTIDASGITNLDIKAGTAAGTLTASVTAGSSPVGGATVTWSSDDESIATVGETTGVVTLVAAGTAHITASYAGDATYAASSDDYEIVVVDTRKQVTLSFSATEIIDYNFDGETLTAPTLTAKDEGDNPIDLANLPELRFAESHASGNATVTVNETTGVISGANSFGTSTITASFAGNANYKAAANKSYTVTRSPYLRQVLFNNGFDAFIKENDKTVEVYYMAGTDAPAQTGEIKVADGFTAEVVGNNVVLTQTATSKVKTYAITKTAVTPFVGTGKQTFSAVPSYVASVYGYDSGKGLKFSKTDNDWTREAPGNTRLYFFVGAAESITLTHKGTARAVKVRVNGGDAAEESGTITNLALNADQPNMIEIQSNQTGGDGGYQDMTLTSPKQAVTVGANGYTTFASTSKLDLTDANRPDGLKAYKAALTGSSLTFTALDQAVPAGTGLLLLGETKGGTYYIPIASESTDVDDNALVGVTTPTAKQSDPSGNYYFVMKKALSASDALTFAPLSSSSAVTIPAGKAYVEVASSAFSGDSHELTISFEESGDVTGISEIKTMRDGENETLYNLAGQRVNASHKGIVIVNGKKYLNK